MRAQYVSAINDAARSPESRLSVLPALGPIQMLQQYVCRSLFKPGCIDMSRPRRFYCAFGGMLTTGDDACSDPHGVAQFFNGDYVVADTGHGHLQQGQLLRFRSTGHFVGKIKTSFLMPKPTTVFTDGDDCLYVGDDFGGRGISYYTSNTSGDGSYTMRGWSIASVSPVSGRHLGFCVGHEKGSVYALVQSHATPHDTFLVKYNVENPYTAVFQTTVHCSAEPGICVNSAGEVCISSLRHIYFYNGTDGHYERSVILQHKQDTGAGFAVDANDVFVQNSLLEKNMYEHGPSCIYLSAGNDGRLLETVSSYGVCKGQLRIPRGVCVTANGHIAVADSLNNRIQVWE
jgi:hypothetical protein